MNKNLRSLLLLALICWTNFSTALAQTAPPSNLNGTELRTWLRQNWYDGKRVVLSYGVARGKMYNYIDNYNNSVVGVYSGFVQPFNYSETSTNTSIPNINCEHTVPQSWFNEADRMRTDIHHLFPTVIQWNSDRGSDPFAEIPDTQTDKWIINLTSQSTIPTSNIDAYSEDTESQFEPREVHKGNLARAIFYFYTMHEGQSFDAGKGVITAVGDLQTLYQWHLQDPVDAIEMERNDRVQRVQGNRNPYIDYPELVASAWGLTPVACSPTTQASQASISEATQTSFKLNWTNGSGNRRLVVIREGSATNFSPSGSYTSGINADFSQATDQGSGHKLVYNGTANTVTVSGLTANRTYHAQVFEYCSTDNTYNTTNAPTAQATLPDYTCTGTPQAATGLTSSEITTNGFTLNFTAGNGDGRVIVIKEGSAPTATPQAGTSYSNASLNFSTAPALSDGSKVVYSGNGTSASIMGVRSNTAYYVVVYERCSNGWLYATGTAPLTVTTELAGGNLPAGVIARQDFENGADDGWAVASGFSSSTDNTGYPNEQRIRGGANSFQLNPAVGGVTLSTLVLESVNTTGYKDVVVELFNSSVATTSGNGMDLNDFIEVYVALNDATFSASPDLKITANATDSNIRYGMNGTGVLETNAGTSIVKTFTVKNEVTGDDAPSRLLVRVPDGTSSVQLKVVLQNNNDKEILNIDDITLYGTATTTGLPKAIESQVVLYPNPTTGAFIVKTPGTLLLLEATVFNNVGKQIATQKLTGGKGSVSFNLPQLVKGMYLIQLKTDKGTVVRRLIVQ